MRCWWYSRGFCEPLRWWVVASWVTDPGDVVFDGMTWCGAVLVFRLMFCVRSCEFLGLMCASYSG